MSQASTDHVADAKQDSRRQPRDGGEAHALGSMVKHFDDGLQHKPIVL